MSEHGLDGVTTPAVLLTAVALGSLGALRWDALRLWWKSLFEPPSEPSLMQIARTQSHLQAPRHLHDSELRHQVLHRRPEFHRSGRRG